ncbi:unnamed protein product [Calypogeia fissa]
MFRHLSTAKYRIFQIRLRTVCGGLRYSRRLARLHCSSESANAVLRWAAVDYFAAEGGVTDYVPFLSSSRCLNTRRLLLPPSLCIRSF